jgi:hypothetical protein
MITRRGFVRLVGGAAAAAALPACGDNIHLPSGAFLDPHMWRTIDAATGVIIPGTVFDPGAQQCLAVRYIDRLLGAFDATPPQIFAGGPASGRQPYADAIGRASKVFPDNDFETFLELPRVRELAWRIRIFGSAATEGGTFNDAVLGETIGLRQRYADGVRALDAAAKEVASPRLYVQLTPEDRSLALDMVATREPEFYRALVEHTLEGMFAAPEYGGNDLLQGWELAQYDGDSIPFGHATYDVAAQRYVDREDQPTAQPSPGDTTEELTPDVIQILTIAAIGSGGKRFY